MKRGVHRSYGKWVAEVQGKYLGIYESKGEAIRVARAARQAEFKEFSGKG